MSPRRVLQPGSAVSYLSHPPLSYPTHSLPHAIGTKHVLSTDYLLGNMLCSVFVHSNPHNTLRRPTFKIKKQVVAVGQKLAQSNTAGDKAPLHPLRHTRRSPVLLKIPPSGYLTCMPSKLLTVVMVGFTFSNMAFVGLPLPITKLCFTLLNSTLYTSHLLSHLSYYV